MGLGSPAPPGQRWPGSEDAVPLGPAAGCSEPPPALALSAETSAHRSDHPKSARRRPGVPRSRYRLRPRCGCCAASAKKACWCALAADGWPVTAGLRRP